MNSYLIIGCFITLSCLFPSQVYAMDWCYVWGICTDTVAPIGKTASAAQSCAAQPAANPQYVGDYPMLDSTIQAFVNENDLPGCALKINQLGNEIFSNDYGLADKSYYTRTSVNVDTSLFRIASISKAITAAAILRLVEDRKLNLGDKVFGIYGHLNQYSFGFHNIPIGFVDQRIYDITIRNLLQHTGGWDRSAPINPLDPNIQGSSDPLSFPMYNTIALQMKGFLTNMNNDDIIQWMGKRTLNFKPGDKFAYSNFGYMLLSEIITKVSGKIYETYVKEDILRPIGITNMRLGKTRQEELAPNEVKYYTNPENEMRESIFPADSYTYISPYYPYPLIKEQRLVSPCYTDFPLENAMGAAGWIATMPDLVKFIHALSGISNQKIFNNANSFATMRAKPTWPWYMVPDETPDGRYYGMGLTVTADGIKYGHEGADPGSTAIMSHDRNGYNFAFACNKGRPNDAAFEAVVRYAISMQRTLQGIYQNVKDDSNNFDSITANKYAVKTMIKENYMSTFINCVKPLGYRLLRVETVQVGGPRMESNYDFYKTMYDYDYWTAGFEFPPGYSVSFQVYYNTLWVKDDAPWEVFLGLDDVTLANKLLQLKSTPQGRWGEVQQYYGVKYLTTYKNSRGQARTTLVTGLSAGTTWNVVQTSLTPTYYDLNPYLTQINNQVFQNLRVVVHSIYRVNGQDYVMTLYSTEPKYQPVVMFGITLHEFIAQDIKSGLIPLHITVTPDPTNAPIVYALYNSVITNGKVYAESSQYNLKVRLLEESRNNRIPVAFPVFEVRLGLAYVASWISVYDFENNY